jgi:hypothetical protein
MKPKPLGNSKMLFPIVSHTCKKYITFGRGKKFSLSTLNLYSGSERKKNQNVCMSVNAS